MTDTLPIKKASFPPPGFIQVTSAVVGITVFAPAPPKDKTAKDLIFTCPRCGATTAYNPGDESVTCFYCGYSQKIEARVVGYSAPAEEFTVQTLEEKGRGWGRERRELKCEACGADFSLAPDDLTASCPFCGSNQVIASTLPADMIRPGYLIPFKLDNAACTARMREWLGRGWMHPAGLSGAANNASVKGVYMPYWTFSAQIDARWEAEVGYERTESYYDAGSRSWRTRTVIDWRWETGRVEVPILNMLENGSQKASPLLLAKIQPFDLSALVEYDPEFLAGWQAKAYDIPLEVAWDQARSRMREQAKSACLATIRSPHVRNFKMAADFNDEAWRFILLPVYLSVYNYQNHIYQIMVNGQTGKVSGQKPVAWRKIWLAILALLAPGLLIGLVSMLAFSGTNTGGVLFGIGAIAFLIGLVITIVILVQAMKAGEA